MEVEFVASSK